MTYDPFTIYYPAADSIGLIFGPQVFVLTINGLQGNEVVVSLHLPASHYGRDAELRLSVRCARQATPYGR